MNVDKQKSLTDTEYETNVVLPFILLLFIIYLVLILPKLPTFVAILFENAIFRIIVIYYIIYIGNKNPQLSLMIAFTFLIIIHTLNKQYIKDLSNSYTL